MNVNTRIILISSLLGILGIAGLVKATYTDRTTLPVAVMPQHHRTQTFISKQGTGKLSVTNRSNLSNDTKSMDIMMSF